MRIGSLFSGIGGLELGLEMSGLGHLPSVYRPYTKKDMESTALSVEAATELLFEAGKEAKHEGADMEHSAKVFETMLAYADPEYIQAAELLGDDALECFQRGLA